MRFLADQDVYASTVRYLRSLGHEVVTASELGLAEADDAIIRIEAQKQGSIFVTRDRDFGALVFVERAGPGVIYLRVSPATERAIEAELGRVLLLYPEQELGSAFVVIEPGRHRIRKLSADSGG